MFPAIWVAYRISFPKADPMEKLLTTVGASFLSTLGNASGEFIKGSSTSPYYASLRGRTITTSGAAASATAIHHSTSSPFHWQMMSWTASRWVCMEARLKKAVPQGWADLEWFRPFMTSYRQVQYRMGQRSIWGLLEITSRSMRWIAYIPKTTAGHCTTLNRLCPFCQAKVSFFAPSSTPNNFKIDEHLLESICLGYGDFMNVDAVRRILEANHAGLSSRLFLCEQNGQKIFDRVQSNHRRPSQ